MAAVEMNFMIVLLVCWRSENCQRLRSFRRIAALSRHFPSTVWKAGKRLLTEWSRTARHVCTR